MDKPELADVLAHVATQLIAAERAAKERGRAVMQLEECEVELSVQIEAEARAGVKVWVVEAGASKNHQNSSKVKVKFRAIPNRGIQAAQTNLEIPAEKITRQPAKKRP